MNLYQKNLLNGLFYTTKNFQENFVITKQVHGDKIVNIDDAVLNELDADGIFWNLGQLDKNRIPCVYTADCLPIVLEGEGGGVIIHAGWRGIQKKIHLNPLINKLKIKTAFIGPSIHKESFEVGEDFQREFPNSSFFTFKNEKIFFGLHAQVQKDLKDKWPNIKMTNSNVCTFKNLTYNSYRRTGLADRNYNFYLKANLP